ncbi:MAG: Gfo/Idh/MocA family oxidoreductase, partial [Clostridia bacterium]|nr:Gfo/Idh/MocA family oxidoreductase [Clostridia bacterium]
KIAILGCENSHADSFIDYILNSGKIDDVEIAGVYSDEEAACKRLNEQFGVYVAKSYDKFVGKIDGLIVTARHGANHYKYAKPYISSGIPMFIDKPITICEKEAVEFMKQLKANNVRVTGGSCCVYDSYVQHIKAVVNGGRYGKVLGGYVRAPLDANSNYGGFYFYAQHLVQVMCEVFGNYPDSVQMFDKGDAKTLVVRYKDYDITGEFVTDNYLYYIGASCEKDFAGDTYTIDSSCFVVEFEEFYKLLHGGEMHQTYKEIIAPVFIMNAMKRSLDNGKEETVTKIEEI